MPHRLSQAEIDQLIAVTPELADEAQHFTLCALCQQAVDMRSLPSILHHLEAGHAPEPIALH